MQSSIRLLKDRSFTLGVVVGILVSVAVYAGMLTAQKYIQSEITIRQMQNNSVYARTVNDFTFAVHSVRFQEISDPLEEGYVYLIADVSFTNSSPHAVMVLPVFQVFIRDELGTTYTMTPIEITQPIIAGELARGAVNRGELAFVVPKNAEDLSLIFDTGWDDSSPVDFPLSL